MRGRLGCGGDIVRSVTILGSTGSIGRSTVDLLLRNPDRFRVEALTGNANVSLLAEQARLLRPKMVAVADEKSHKPLVEAMAGTGILVASGAAALVEAA
ncbi:MAG: 1-deoxy-D-xylulose-5-phosphate reductoisomerase, partial [Alphaproteobacteria bacterium]|nr:1-deoxy-D-xylulose-5-phosphate reductoisomerase [Alphaproteobacteria bacterium]